MKKQELITYLKNFKTTYDYEKDYYDIYNSCIEYMNESRDFSIEDKFYDYVNYETAEEIAKQELENGGLIRIYYFLGDANLNNGMFKIDGYGNLTDFYKEDLDFLITEIIESLEYE